ncbi:MAG: tryptophan--tRNA ligase [Fibromonadaceae bacterium]|jgi:tryptophanyl-tRNA synthetase|nr:tryptophan--tRNA ligase [Fibromonadaceae bacterium]
MSKPISLTGIKPTGTPHLGNYLGAIRPALELRQKYSTVYFIADYHALTTVHSREEMQSNTHKVAATWLALGLNPEEGLFYKQSDIPEIFELSWLLSCFTPKGFMNRAHAYKDKVAKNQAAGTDPDDGVNMGLYCYPCLMNADILMFKSDIVPVGKDQKQHVEFSRDVAERFNKQYGKDIFVLPEPVIQAETDIIPGLDGRKMSKSYDNTIEIFLSSKELKAKVGKIVTNSQGMEEPKDPEKCNVFALYKLFANKEQIAALDARYRAGGMGWGHAKEALRELLEEHLAESREKYNALLADTSQIDKILAYGAEKARAIAKPFMQEIRDTIGI